MKLRENWFLERVWFERENWFLEIGKEENGGNSDGMCRSLFGKGNYQEKKIAQVKILLSPLVDIITLTQPYCLPLSANNSLTTPPNSSYKEKKQVSYTT